MRHESRMQRNEVGENSRENCLTWDERWQHRELFTLRWKMTAQRTAYIERGGENRENCLSWGGGENRENCLLWCGEVSRKNYLLWGGRWEQTELFTLRSSGTDSFLCSMALRWEMSTRIEQRTNFFSSCRSCMRWPQWLRSWGLQHTNTHMLCKGSHSSSTPSYTSCVQLVTCSARYHTHTV